MKNVLACLIASVFRQSVSQSLSLFVCLAAAAAQAPSLNVLRCCSRVAKKKWHNAEFEFDFDIEFDRIW